MDGSIKAAILLQAIMTSLLCLEAIGLKIPLLRQLVGFVYLTIIPGMLLLRAIGLQRLSVVHALLYSIGLSVSLLMFVGLLLNALYPLVAGPISIFPLMLTLSVAVLSLCAFVHYRRSGPSPFSEMDLSPLLSRPSLFLYSLPLLTVLGMYLINFYGNNALLLALMALISLTVILVSFDKFIPRRLFPLAIVAISVALLYHQSLLSNYLPGWDINFEYYFSNLVIGSSHWDYSIHNVLNAMASIVMLSPIYSLILGIDDIWVFKIIYPFIFSFVPMALYQIYCRLTSEKEAFLATFFFISFFTFFTEMIALARQEIAELFFALLILIMMDTRITQRKAAVMSIVFALSLIISHYGLSYIYVLFYLIPACLLYFLMKNLHVGGAPGSKHGAERRDFHFNIGYNSNSNIIASVFVLLYIVSALSWYTYVSNAAPLEAIVSIADHMWKSIFTDFLLGGRDPLVMMALGGALPVASLQREVYRIIQYITQIFIAIGVIELVMKGRGKIQFEYIVMSLASVVMILMCIILPFFASSLRMTRLYHITLFFLSPLCISGGIALFRPMLKLFKIDNKKDKSIYSLAFVLIVLIVYFMFNTGFVYEVTGDVPSSVSLGLMRLKNSSGDIKVNLYSFYTDEAEVFSAKWLSRYRDVTHLVFSDKQAQQRILPPHGMISNAIALSNETRIYVKAYIYLKELNVLDGLVTYASSAGIISTFKVEKLSPILDTANKIYSNGGSSIYEILPKYP